MDLVTPSAPLTASSADAPAKPPVLRRIGLIGDVHGERDALAATLHFLQAQPNLDALLCTGDVPGVEPDGDSDACARLLTDAGVLTIRGNHDRWALLDGADSLFKYTGTAVYYDFARDLPPCVELEVPFGLALLCHGVGTNDMEGIYPSSDDAPLITTLRGRRIYGRNQVIICGHTHHRLVRTIGTLTIVINAGTLRRDNEPCFSLVDFETGEAQFYNLDSETHAITTAEICRFLKA